MKAQVALWAGFLTATVFPAPMQEPQPAGPGVRIDLSLRQAIDLALAEEGNVRLRLAREFIQQNRARSRQARAELLPHVDGRADWTSNTRNLRAFGLGVETGIGSLVVPDLVGPFDILDVRGQASQMIFDLGSIRRYQASQTALDAARAEEVKARDQTIEEVARAYLSGLRAQALRETAQANVALAERLFELATSQKEAGTGTGIEVTRASVQLASERQASILAEHQLRSALLQLRKVARLRLEAQIRLTDRLGYEAVDQISAERALEQARLMRADWKAQLQHQKQAEQTYSAAKWDRLPSFHAFGDYGTIGIAGGVLRPTRTVGVSATIPLFAGGAREARREEAASLLRQEKIRKDDLLERIELEVRIALDSLLSAETQVTVAADGLDLAESELAQAERRYRAGVANSVEITDAQTRLQRARSNQVDALYNHNLARLDLKAAMGRIREIIP